MVPTYPLKFTRHNLLNKSEPAKPWMRKRRCLRRMVFSITIMTMFLNWFWFRVLKKKGIMYYNSFRLQNKCVRCHILRHNNDINVSLVVSTLVVVVSYSILIQSRCKVIALSVCALKIKAKVFSACIAYSGNSFLSKYHLNWNESSYSDRKLKQNSLLDSNLIQNPIFASVHLPLVVY